MTCDSISLCDAGDRDCECCYGEAIADECWIFLVGFVAKQGTRTGVTLVSAGEDAIGYDSFMLHGSRARAIGRLRFGSPFLVSCLNMLENLSPQSSLGSTLMPVGPSTRARQTKSH